MSSQVLAGAAFGGCQCQDADDQVVHGETACPGHQEAAVADSVKTGGHGHGPTEEPQLFACLCAGLFWGVLAGRAHRISNIAAHGIEPPQFESMITFTFLSNLHLFITLGLDSPPPRV